MRLHLSPYDGESFCCRYSAIDHASSAVPHKLTSKITGYKHEAVEKRTSMNTATAPCYMRGFDMSRARSVTGNVTETAYEAPG